MKKATGTFLLIIETYSLSIPKEEEIKEEMEKTWKDEIL